MYIVYILYIVSLLYARNMHGKEVFLDWFRTCDLAEKGVTTMGLHTCIEFLSTKGL